MAQHTTTRTVVYRSNVVLYAIELDRHVRPIEGVPHMSITMPFPVEDLFELRLFLEELVCNVCRFVHVAEQGISPQELRIRQEVSLGIPNAFSDILIRVPNHSSYFV